MRLFVAFELTPAVRAHVVSALEKVKPGSPHSKWVPPENLHVTLVFLGAVPDERVPELISALDRVGERHAPVTVSTSRGGSFGTKRHPRVLWVGLEGELEPLTRIFADVEEAMTGFGYTPENRAYHPHITLARAREMRGDPSLADCAEALQTLEPKRLRVDHLSLVKSTPGRGGSKYEVIHRAPLSKGPASTGSA